MLFSPGGQSPCPGRSARAIVGIEPERVLPQPGFIRTLLGQARGFIWKRRIEQAGIFDRAVVPDQESEDDEQRQPGKRLFHRRHPCATLPGSSSQGAKAAWRGRIFPEAAVLRTFAFEAEGGGKVNRIHATSGPDAGKSARTGVPAVPRRKRKAEKAMDSRKPVPIFFR